MKEFQCAGKGEIGILRAQNGYVSARDFRIFPNVDRRSAGDIHT